MSYKVPLDSRTVLLGSTIQDILKRTEKTRKGIDFRLYTVAGSGGRDTEDYQTVLTTLSSMNNPTPVYQRQKQDVDTLLAEALDRVLISDRVRSCNDFYKTNNKKDNSLLTVG
jgi:hypothetical protein